MIASHYIIWTWNKLISERKFTNLRYTLFFQIFKVYQFECSYSAFFSSLSSKENKFVLNNTVIVVRIISGFHTNSQNNNSNTRTHEVNVITWCGCTIITFSPLYCHSSLMDSSIPFIRGKSSSGHPIVRICQFLWLQQFSYVKHLQYVCAWCHALSYFLLYIELLTPSLNNTFLVIAISAIFNFSRSLLTSFCGFRKLPDMCFLKQFYYAFLDYRNVVLSRSTWQSFFGFRLFTSLKLYTRYKVGFLIDQRKLSK